MAMVGLRVPHETARLLSEVEVPGQREALSSLHITLLFLGDNVPIEVLAQALVATFNVTSRTRPFTVRTSTLTCFPKGDNEGVPVICRVDSDPLHELQGRLKTSYETMGVPFSKKHPTYKPHVTLSYSEEEVEEQRIPTVEWGAHELVLWGGDDGDRRLVMTFPFSLDASHEIALRVAQRYSLVPEAQPVA